MDKPPGRREPVKLTVVSGEGLGELEKAIQKAIAYRAYELYSQRGRSHGHDLEDWFHAESDLVKPEDVHILDAAGQWVIQARAQGFSAEQLQIGASPRKVIIWGQGPRPGAAAEKYPPQLLGEIELPSPALPEKSSAALNGDLLEIRVSKEEPAGAIASG